MTFFHVIDFERQMGIFEWIKEKEKCFLLSFWATNCSPIWRTHHNLSFFFSASKKAKSFFFNTKKDKTSPWGEISVQNKKRLENLLVLRFSVNFWDMIIVSQQLDKSGSLITILPPLNLLFSQFRLCWSRGCLRVHKFLRFF